jgi:cupin 2 domain-containing protein
MRPGQANIFKNIPDHIPKELFENLLGQDNLRIERIVSWGHSTPDGEWYDQLWHEWVLVLQGEAVLRYDDGTTARMQAGDYANILAHTKHRVEWTQPGTKTVWLAIHYQPR